MAYIKFGFFLYNDFHFIQYDFDFFLCFHIFDVYAANSYGSFKFAMTVRLYTNVSISFSLHLTEFISFSVFHLLSRNKWLELSKQVKY